MSIDKFNDSGCYAEDDRATQPFDEKKPRVPYVKGLRFTVQQHIPPPPVKLHPAILCTFEDKKESKKMRQLHPIERCFQYPPLPGSYGSLNLELKIHDTIRIGDRHNAQIVLVEVLMADPPVKGLSQGQRVVAKLYDPMYIHDDDFYINPFLVADKGYTHETAAYETLSNYQGTTIPDYYGSYSLDILTDASNYKRTVRLVLIEFIPGLSMQKADPDKFSQETRQSLMKSLIEFETSVYAKNVLLNDLHPRNVMVTNPDSQHRHAVFIDFGDADVGCGAASVQSETKSFEFRFDNYVPSLLRWHQDQFREDSFYDWIDWDWQPWLQTEFASTAEAITPGMLECYVPYSFHMEMGENVGEALHRIIGC